MKKVLIFFLLFTYLAPSQSHHGKVTYEVNTHKSKITKQDSNSNFSTAKKNALEHLRNATPVKVFLLFNQQESLYFVEEKLKDESQKKINFLFFYAGGTNLFYHNLVKKYNIIQTDATGSTSRISYKPKEWVLTKETKKIENYLCYKATLKSKPSTVAWYTPEIPLRHGPKGYNNLPGLILELNIGKSYWVVKKIEFNNPEAQNIVEPTKGKLITEEEYREYSKGIFKEN